MCWLYREPVPSTRGLPGNRQPARLAPRATACAACLVYSSPSPSTRSAPTAPRRQSGWVRKDWSREKASRDMPPAPVVRAISTRRPCKAMASSCWRSARSTWVSARAKSSSRGEPGRVPGLKQDDGISHKKIPPTPGRRWQSGLAGDRARGSRRICGPRGSYGFGSRSRPLPRGTAPK